MRDLCRRHGVKAPSGSVIHFSADLGPFRVKWERHTDFVRYMFVVPGETADPFPAPSPAPAPSQALLESMDCRASRIGSWARRGHANVAAGIVFDAGVTGGGGW